MDRHTTSSTSLCSLVMACVMLTWSVWCCCLLPAAMASSADHHAASSRNLPAVAGHGCCASATSASTSTPDNSKSDNSPQDTPGTSGTPSVPAAPPTSHCGCQSQLVADAGESSYTISITTAAPIPAMDLPLLRAAWLQPPLSRFQQSLPHDLTDPLPAAGRDLLTAVCILTI